MMRGILLALALAAGLASAAPAVTQKGQGSKTAIWSTGTTDDPKTIDDVLSAMPMTDKDMTYANMGERLQQLGIRVKHINAGPVSVDDVRLDPSLRRGDIHYIFAITKSTTIVEQLCPIGPGFTMIRRGQRWIAQDRTGNFLMNGYGHCQSPRQ